MPKHGVFSSLYFPVFGQENTNAGNTVRIQEYSLNIGKYGPEKTPYLETFHAVIYKDIAEDVETTFDTSNYE